MINDFIKWGLDLIDYFYNLIPSNYNLITKIQDLITSLSTYQNTWNEFTSVIYFILGKPLVVTCISVGVCIIVVKLIFAIINIVGQYVP